MKYFVAFVCLGLVFGHQAVSATDLAVNESAIKSREDLGYKSGSTANEYENERCKLDVYLPTDQTNFPTMVWFHGGGLKAGDKREAAGLARSLAGVGVAVVCPNYRLSPKVKYPAYVEDAAAAVAWTRDHIAQNGGDTNKLFIGGHSAGGWLTLMVGLDERYLQSHGLRTSDLTGLIPVSGQTMTHYTVREERGIGQFTVTADEAAPVHFARAKTPPMLVLYADRDMAARAEENAYFVALMKGAGNSRVNGLLVQGRDHGSIAAKIADDGDPARVAILNFIRTQSEPAAPK
jgi:acetyl esterase/lipase